jgi:LPXTG-motif cell wall-anchored protein
MRKLLLAAAAVFALSGAAQAQTVVANLGTNPNSATGTFNHAVFGATFQDIYQFSLDGPAPAHITFGTAENTFTNDTDFITGFVGQLFRQIGGVAGDGNDIPVNPPTFAQGCPTNPAGCQVLSGTAILANGDYYLDLRGTGGGTSGYSGSVTTLAVPGPILGGGLPALLGLAGFTFWRRRRNAA